MLHKERVDKQPFIMCWHFTSLETEEGSDRYAFEYYPTIKATGSSIKIPLTKCKYCGDNCYFINKLCNYEPPKCNYFICDYFYTRSTAAEIMSLKGEVDQHLGFLQLEMFPFPTELKRKIKFMIILLFFEYFETYEEGNTTFSRYTEHVFIGKDKSKGLQMRNDFEIGAFEKPLTKIYFPVPKIIGRYYE